MAGDGDLTVKPEAVLHYGNTMNKSAIGAFNPVQQALSQAGLHAQQAFSGSAAGGPFPESKVIMAALEAQSSAFTQFASDLTRGMRAIGGAATVCAYAYNGTDWESAEKMNLLGYAFDTDPNAPRPEGLKGLPAGVFDKSLDDLAAEAAAAGNNAPQSQTNPDGGSSVYPSMNTQYTSYPDGSRRSIESYPVDGNPDARRRVTKIYDQHGNLIGTTTEDVEYHGDGTQSTYYRQVDTPGQVSKDADGKETRGPAVTVKTTTRPDASGANTVIVTETEVEGEKPTTRIDTVENVPVVADPGRGPTQEAVDDLEGDFGPGGPVNWRAGNQSVSTGR